MLYPQACHIWGSYLRRGLPPGWGTSAHPRDLPSLWHLALFYEELRCNFFEPRFFGFFIWVGFGVQAIFTPLGKLR